MRLSKVYGGTALLSNVVPKRIARRAKYNHDNNEYTEVAGVEGKFVRGGRG
jgi:hypothetical protein